MANNQTSCHKYLHESSGTLSNVEGEVSNPGELRGYRLPPLLTIPPEQASPIALFAWPMTSDCPVGIYTKSFNKTLWSKTIAFFFLASHSQQRQSFNMTIASTPNHFLFKEWVEDKFQFENLHLASLKPEEENRTDCYSYFYSRQWVKLVDFSYKSCVLVNS